MEEIYIEYGEIMGNLWFLAIIMHSFSIIRDLYAFFLFSFPNFQFHFNFIIFP